MKFSARRLIITIIFVLLIGAATVISVFLNTFDLNNFRAQISDTLSSRLSQPVNLGQAHFSIKHGPSFAFSDVLVGTKDAPLHLTADHVFFRLEVLPLLSGQFKFSEILFEKPDVTLKIGQQQSPDQKRRRVFFDQSLVAGDLVKSLRIKDGNFRLEDYRRSDKPFIIALEKMRMVVDDLSLQQSGWIEIRGDINANNILSPLRLSGYIKAGDSTPFWNNAHYELEMRITDFASDVLSQRYKPASLPIKIHGRTNINIQLTGIPAKGLRFKTILTGKDLGLVLSKRTKPILAGKIAASGIWQNIGHFHKFTESTLQFGDIELYGDVNFNLAKNDPEIRMQLKAPRIALTDLNRFLYRENTDTATEKHPVFTAGTFKLKAFNFSGPASQFSSPGMLLGIKKIDFEVRKGDLSLGEDLKLFDCYSKIEWNKGLLQVKKLKIHTKKMLFNSTGEFQLENSTETGDLQLAGQGKLNIKNLTTIKPLLPEKGLNISLHLDARHNDGIWTLSNNLLALPSIKMIIQGKWDRKETQSLSLDVNIPEFSLLDLPLISPAIKAIRPEGHLSANVHLEANKQSPLKLNGSLDLQHVHLKILGPLAALDKLNGKIELDWPHLGGKNLSANLGESPIDLGLDIPDLRKPMVNLAIKGDSIRANELIFRSEKQFLRDVDAKVSITDKALLLGPIHTRMDGGTDVTVNGTIDNFPAADTHLTIEGKYGNIDEVIGLWISDQSREKKGKRRKQGLLEIDIKTEAGEIANLPFESSEAHISYRDRTLVIHPINFKYGEGLGIGQVLVKFRDDQPPLLAMSGHLENFDALAVYQQLLQRKGIVTGKLRGDFYLEGSAGKLKETFLPSSFGAFNFEVRDGTLKKLNSLSQALTIFNIYPLFTSSGKERGVPFDKLEGTARLDNGLLQSGNVFMKGDVMNMSMSGTQNLITTEVDMELGIMPLRTIDRLITKIPLAGWILTGEDKALVTAHFKLTGPGDNPEITAIPVESASKQVIGIFKRIFTLPVKIISDVGEAIE